MMIANDIGMEIFKVVRNVKEIGYCGVQLSDEDLERWREYMVVNEWLGCDGGRLYIDGNSGEVVLSFDKLRKKMGSLLQILEINKLVVGKVFGEWRSSGVLGSGSRVIVIR